MNSLANISEVQNENFEKVKKLISSKDLSQTIKLKEEFYALVDGKPIFVTENFDEAHKEAEIYLKKNPKKQVVILRQFLSAKLTRIIHGKDYYGD